MRRLLHLLGLCENQLRIGDFPTWFFYTVHFVSNSITSSTFSFSAIPHNTTIYFSSRETIFSAWWSTSRKLRQIALLFVILFCNFTFCISSARKKRPCGHFSFVVGSTTRAVMPCPHKNGGKQFSQSTPHTPLGCGGALLFRVNSPQASTNRCELPQNILQLVILCLNSTICI